MINGNSTEFKIRLKVISDYNDYVYNNIMAIGLNKMTHINIYQKLLLSSLMKKAMALHSENTKLINFLVNKPQEDEDMSSYL